MEKQLYAIADLCTGCNRCSYMCSATKLGIFKPSEARIHISNFPLKGYSVPSICFQCPKADCMKACAEKAISKNNDDVVVVDVEKCTGCGDCVSACPYGMIDLNSENIAYKCDYCGGDPACVKECQPGAILYAEGDKEIRKLRGIQMKQRIQSGSIEQERHSMGLSILERARGVE